MASFTVPFTFTYRKPGTRPPIFVAGTFTSPPWQLQEMDWRVGEDGEHTFAKVCEIDPTQEIQYKFKIGLGDWWAACEDSPTTSDGIGNVNNIIKPKSRFAAVLPAEDGSKKSNMSTQEQVSPERIITPAKHEKFVPEQEIDEAGSTTGTELSEEIPSPSHVPTLEGPNVIIHDEAAPILEREHEEAAIEPKSVGGGAPLIRCTGSPLPRPIDADKSTDKAETTEEDEPEAREVQEERTEDTQTASSSEQASEDEHEDAEQTEDYLAESSYESASEEATTTGVEVAGAHPESALRHRGTQPGDEITAEPLPADDAKHGNPISAFFRQLMQWIRHIFRVIFRRNS